ncbi:helix-turn-helix domain-containing protein [Marinobacter maritimus]|uniref:helix-turn-helix domain-containing protein n=1 Tax=Marinobacter maritimus TaxID=277961 RepID=UPI001C92C981|nr:helix-turn-helix transcriptional regulator [Marinobacter maritimus]
MQKEAQQSKNKPCSPELLDTLATNIRWYRKEKGLSQERLAELAGMHRTFISLIERRGRNVTLGVVEAIAVQLGVDVPTLLSKNKGTRLDENSG